MRKRKIVLGILIMTSLGMLVSCGTSNASNEPEKKTEDVKTEKAEEGFDGFVDGKSGIELKYPKELVKEEGKEIKFSGILEELENKKTERELEEEKKKDDKESEEVKREPRPLTLEIESLENKDELSAKEYADIQKSNLRKVQYVVTEKDRYVISWKENDLIYYESGIVNKEKIAKFRYSFAEDKKENYNKVLQVAYDSFKIK
ncbi:MAG: hypothetical protein ACRC28_00170 [Clostridium sp.]|uniref:hypothetical protein n=1 Tax=Clostridium sp. TaxID=1506 RepID=UPI003F3C1235